MEVHGERVSGAARRRRQRRLRQWHRHERLAVQMALATAAHHSAQPDEALRRQRTARAREVEEQDQHEALRRQMAPPLGMRPGVLQDPAPQGRVGQHSGIGYELVLALDVPVLQMAEQPVDASALAFLEEAEANDLEVGYMELVRSGFSKSPASLERMREVVRRRQVLHQKGRGRKKKKRKKRKLPKGSSPRSLHARAVRTRKSGHLSCGSSWCSVSGCCLTSPGLLDYWETTFSMFPYSTLSLVRFWIHAHASVYSSFGTAPCIWQSLVRRCLCLRSTVSPFFWEMTSGFDAVCA